MKIALTNVLVILIAFNSMGQKMFENLVEIELSDHDKQWIEKYLQTADSLIDKFYKGEIKEKYDPIVLDEVFRSCLREVESGVIKPETVQDALGVAFGTFLNMTMESRWLVIKDSYGTDLAVKFKNGGYAFPLSTVQKRIESKETGFFETTYLTFKEKF